MSNNLTKEQRQETKICPFCGGKPEWVENKTVYGGVNFGKSYMIWLCRPCDAFVGCHNNTKVPLGTMANEEMREWRKKAHAAFDPLWKSGDMTRANAYRMLVKKLGKTIHIAESDVEQCKKIITAVQEHNHG